MADKVTEVGDTKMIERCHLVAAYVQLTGQIPDWNALRRTFMSRTRELAQGVIEKLRNLGARRRLR